MRKARNACSRARCRCLNVPALGTWQEAPSHPTQPYAPVRDPPRRSAPYGAGRHSRHIMRPEALMTRRTFFALVCALSIASLPLRAGSSPARAKLGMVDHAERHRLANRLRGHQERRQRDRCCGRDRIRDGGHASDRRQHRRRRLHRLSARQRRADGLRLPRSRPVAVVTGDVADRRQVRLREAP